MFLFVVIIILLKKETVNVPITGDSDPQRQNFMYEITQRWQKATWSFFSIEIYV